MEGMAVDNRGSQAKTECIPLAARPAVRVGHYVGSEQLTGSE